MYMYRLIKNKQIKSKGKYIINKDNFGTLTKVAMIAKATIGKICFLIQPSFHNCKFVVHTKNHMVS